MVGVSMVKRQEAAMDREAIKTEIMAVMIVTVKRMNGRMNGQTN